MIRNKKTRWMLTGALMGAATLALAMNFSSRPVRADEKAPSAASTPAQALAVKDISLDQAQAAVAAAIVKAGETNTKMDIAVVDAGGNLKAFSRMDGAWLGSIDISIKKAKTARFFDMPTGEIGKLSQPGGPLYQIEVSNGGLITFPGGVPLKSADGTIIGAIGVSGSTVENDHAVATAGAEAIK
jgi:uncharacterized protein GlcG (DUF336 family)